MQDNAKGRLLMQDKAKWRLQKLFKSVEVFDSVEGRGY